MAGNLVHEKLGRTVTEEQNLSEEIKQVRVHLFYHEVSVFPDITAQLALQMVKTNILQNNSV